MLPRRISLDPGAASKTDLKPGKAVLIQVFCVSASCFRGIGTNSVMAILRDVVVIVRWRVVEENDATEEECLTTWNLEDWRAYLYILVENMTRNIQGHTRNIQGQTGEHSGSDRGLILFNTH